MYTFDSRVRYSEIAANKQLRLSSIVNYFQDCSTFQSEDIGKGLLYFAKQKRAWILTSWQIIIEQLPELGDCITIGTWAYSATHAYAGRNFILKKGPKTCAIANSIWVLVDTEKQCPVRITDNDLSGYCMEAQYDMPAVKRKIPVPTDCDSYPAILIDKDQIDTNQHVNNARYIQLAECYLPESFHVHQIRAEYRSSALLGSTILPKVHLDSTTCTIVLTNETNQIYAIVAFDGIVS